MEPKWDLVVIGGGVNGTGIARDAAMRGLRVLLVERRDFASGSSGANSGMIHGGFRYLLNDTNVTRLSCIDSGHIQRIASHLLFRIPFLFPLGAPREENGRTQGNRRSGHRTLGDRTYDYLLEVFFGTYDLYQPLKNGRPHARLSREEALSLEPGLSPWIHGALSFDEYGIDPFRLCALNARSAAEHGAILRNHTEVVGFLRGDDGAITGVRLRKSDDGTAGRRLGSTIGAVEREERARLVVNAGGPWAGRIARLAGVDVRLRPGKGVHLTLDRRLSNYGVISTGKDGRQVFAMPHESVTIVGTTDDDFYGDPDDIPITRDEVDYLMEGVGNVLPSVRHARVLRAWAGVRNTAFAWGPDEDRLSREHELIDHARDGAPGLFTLVGGKLASYRAQSEEAVDVLCRRLRRDVTCTTHEVPLPGARTSPISADLESRFGADPYVAARLKYRHGVEAVRVLEMARQEPRLAAIVCSCEGVIGAELVHAIRSENAAHLVDLRRRCRLAMGVCQGAGCIPAAAAVLAGERELAASDAHTEIVSLQSERWRGQQAGAGARGLAQLELSRAALMAVGAPTTTGFLD